MTDRPKTTLRDCIYGLAVGDALGVPYELRPRGTFKCTDMIGYGTHGQPDGTWSDDTSMTLATCDSIRELGHIDTADMRDKFIGWIARGEYTIDGVFDYGGTTARALHTGKGGSGERDNGNGSLMRIAPLAFTDTTTAVAGALAGTAYGIDAIPREWIDTLRGKELIESCLF